MVLHFAEPTDEDKLIILENKATEIRKILLGALLLAKEIWKDELEQRKEGIEILKTIEEEEEAFINKSFTDRFEKLEGILNVIHKRAKGLFLLLDDARKNY